MVDTYTYFIEAIKSHLINLKRCEDKLISSAIRRALRRELQYYTEVLPRLVSVKAFEYNQSNKKLNLQTLNANSGVKTKGLLVCEHTIPLSKLMNDLLKMDNDLIEETLINYPGCCWITKEEDDKLNSMGYKTSRPYGWEKSYENCGISLVEQK